MGSNVGGMQHVKFIGFLGAFMAFFLGMLVLSKQRKHTSDYLLLSIIWLVAFTVFTFNRILAQGEQMLHWWYTYFPPLFLIPPLVYLYVCSFSQKINLRSFRTWVHTLPAMGVTIFLSLEVFFLDTDTKLTLYRQTQADQYPGWHRTLLSMAFFGVFPYYLYRIYRSLRQHEQYVLTKFSYTEDIDLAWLNRLLWCIAIVWLSYVCMVFVAKQWLGFDLPQPAVLPLYLAVGAIFLIGVYGLRQPNVFVAHVSVNPETVVLEAVPASGPPEKYSHSTLSPAQAQQYLTHLSELMETEKPYLEPRLTIKELAALSKIPASHLSQVLNEAGGQNFYEFVNAYRISEFKRLVIEPDYQHYSLLGLAHEAGFNSKSTFNAIFKKATGMTPSEYRIAQMKSKHL